MGFIDQHGTHHPLRPGPRTSARNRWHKSFPSRPARDHGKMPLLGNPKPGTVTINGLVSGNIYRKLLAFCFHCNYLVGGWPTPLKNDGVRQLGWWHSQYDGKVIKFHGSKPPTSHGLSHILWKIKMFQTTNKNCSSASNVPHNPYLHLESERLVVARFSDNCTISGSNWNAFLKSFRKRPNVLLK
jgi:hypothetical protein